MGQDLALSLAYTTPWSVGVGIGPSDHAEKGRCWCSSKFKVPEFGGFFFKGPSHIGFPWAAQCERGCEELQSRMPRDAKGQIPVHVGAPNSDKLPGL